MIRLPAQVHYIIYIASLCLLAAALPLSVYLISNAMIILTINWLLEDKPYEKWQKIKNKKVVWVISLFYLVHLLGMLYTSDYDWGFHDLRIKLPLLVLPLVIGTSKPIEEKYIKMILSIFAGALLINSIITTFRFITIYSQSFQTMADSSKFIDYIRLSLMVNVSIFSMFWLFNKLKSKLKWIYIGIIAWFIGYLFLLQSLTGIIIFSLVSIILLVRLAVKSNYVWLRWTSILVAFLLLGFSGSYIERAYTYFFTFDKIDFTTLQKTTAQGNPYWHSFTKKDVENGHYTYIYICEPELRNAWNKRSRFQYDSLNRQNQVLKYPLIRYLTSKGLRKDADGINHLTDTDIRNIEWGLPNYIFANKYSFYPRIYKAIWELYNYYLGENPTGFSISQRIEALKAASHIIRNNFWMGTGTGDVRLAFKEQYEFDHSPLAIENRIRAHNQWITFLVTFGTIGLLIIMFSLLAPVFMEKKLNDYLFLLIFLIGFLSFLNEDTLETHAGISFFAFFYCLFLFRKSS